MILYILALGSPTHPISSDAWSAWTSTYRWGSYYGQEHVGFAPLFGHQYSHLWIDFRGIQDAYMRSRGMDYFENSRRAVYAQRSYAIDNPNGWAGYSDSLWGLSASDGPGDTTLVVNGRTVPELGCGDIEYLVIDQGALLGMIENYRSELVWRYMRRSPYIVKGLKRAGFTGGWLDSARVE
jgi:hypothetical protein